MSDAARDDGGEAALREALRRWDEAGLVLPVWWRDDDAVEAGPALGRLLDAARRHGAPLSLAVIPAGATAGLAAALADEPSVDVLQHGFAHANHAAEGGRAVECGGARGTDAVLGEFARGRAGLAALFGARALPVLVPPWNRIEERIADRLAGEGYRGLSVFGPSASPSRPGLAETNAHLDLLRWKGGARFAGAAKLLAAAAGELERRRTAAAAGGGVEPFGLLTHHLVHDEATWSFLDRFLALLAASRAVRWLGARQAFGLAGAGGTGG